MNIEEYKVEKLGRRWVLFNPELMQLPKDDYFSCTVMKTKGLLTGRADGRGETCFYRAEDKTWALRHYLRGGFIARFLHDQYLGLRLKKTRAWEEWHLLNQMQALKLPVPKPVAASVIKSGLFYRADLITEFLDNTETLSDILENSNIDASVWLELGKVVRLFHNHSVFHSDLNARNILLDENKKIYLIDFDRCSFKQGDDWKENNLNRLKRSLLKFKSKVENFNFEESDWQSLLKGYAS
jgi:3-deoxy-D-manno-octulosonic acid kinase